MWNFTFPVSWAPVPCSSSGLLIPVVGGLKYNTGANRTPRVFGVVPGVVVVGVVGVAQPLWFVSLCLKAGWTPDQ